MLRHPSETAVGVGQVGVAVPQLYFGVSIMTSDLSLSLTVSLSLVS